MKIVKLTAENFKKLKAIEIRPNGNTVVISGKNGAGKSSVLDAIWFALCGKDAGKHTSQPIREGEKKAVVSVDLGDYIVTRNWTSNEKSYLKVESKDGAKYSNPQTLLDKLTGELTFDPLSFINLDEKKQVQTLLRLVNLESVLEKIESERKYIYDDRTLANKELNTAEVRLKEIPLPDPSLPTEEIKIEDIFSKLQQAQETYEKNQAKREELVKLRTEVANYNKEKDELEKKLVNLNRSINEICKKGTELKEEVDKLIDPAINEIKNELVSSQDINRKIRDAKSYKIGQEYITKKKAYIEELTRKINENDEKKVNALTTAKFPIDGLGFNDTGVTFRNTPLKQCSTSEQIKVSTALAIALNPKLRIIRIMDGSLLDSNTLSTIESMIKDKDYQVWIEKVDESGKVGIYIEDGEIKEQTK